MNPVKLRFYTEKYEKEKKYFRFHETFVAIPRAEPLTGKFYAKHDAIPASEIRPEYVDLVAKRTILRPRDIYAFRPPTVNMEYGWFTDSLIPPAMNDSRLRFPRTRTDFIANELRIRHVMKGLPVEKFTGMPFKV